MLRLHLILVVLFSIATFVAYTYDKFAAQSGAYRVPERILYGLNLAGGAPGGWAGMFLWRHKTLHLSFYAVQSLGLLLHGAAAFAFAFPEAVASLFS